jgi:hypothetical protein
VHVVDCLEVVEVLRVDIGDDTDLRRELDEGAVRLVGLHDHPRSPAKSGVRAPIVDDAASDDSGIKAACCKDVSDQRGGRRLTVRAGD